MKMRPESSFSWAPPRKAEPRTLTIVSGSNVDTSTSLVRAEIGMPSLDTLQVFTLLEHCLSPDPSVKSEAYWVVSVFRLATKVGVNYRHGLVAGWLRFGLVSALEHRTGPSSCFDSLGLFAI